MDGPAGEPVIAIALEGSNLLVRARLNGKNFRKILKTINEHGAIIYLTPEQKRIDSLMLLVVSLGIPAVILGGIFLQFVLGVKLFPNQPTPRGIFDPKDTPG